jgi:hypothetical protein
MWVAIKLQIIINIFHDENLGCHEIFKLLFQILTALSTAIGGTVDTFTGCLMLAVIV